MRLRYLLLLVFSLCIFTGCNDDDDSSFIFFPPKVNRDFRIGDVTTDRATVPLYERIELQVTLNNATVTNPYDPDPTSGGMDLKATFVSPTAETWVINGFWDGSSWKVRFAPDTMGSWTFSVAATDSSGTVNWTGGDFLCTPGTTDGWLRINGRFLSRMDGSSKILIGHNTGWQYEVQQPTMVSMASRGENLLSFWMAVPWAEPSWTSVSEPYWDDRSAIETLEGGLGVYNQAACEYLDSVIENAEASQIHVLPTIWSHGQLRDPTHPWDSGGGNSWWYNNAYKTVCGVADFFKMDNGSGGDTLQWHYQKNLYRYIIARWGYSQAVAGWVLLCEAEGTSGWEDDSTQVQAWCAAVGNYFAVNDKFRKNAGGDYPMVTSKTDWEGDAATWNSGLDLRALDSYRRQNSNTLIAAQIGDLTKSMWTSTQPSFIAEFGGYTAGSATEPTHYHNGIWPGLAAGGAFVPLRWCDGGDWPMMDEVPAMRDHLEYLSQFIGNVNFYGPGLMQATATYGAGVEGWGIRLSDQGILWSFRAAGNIDGESFTVTGLDEGVYKVFWYNPHASCTAAISSPDINAPGGSLPLTAPALGHPDVACRFVRTGPIPPPAPAAVEEVPCPVPSE